MQEGGLCRKPSRVQRLKTPGQRVQTASGGHCLTLPYLVRVRSQQPWHGTVRRSAPGLDQLLATYLEPSGKEEPQAILISFRILPWPDLAFSG